MKVLSTFLSVLLTPLVAVMPLRAELPNGLADPLPVPAATKPGPSVPGTTPTGKSSALQIRLADSAGASVEANSIQAGYSVVVTDSSGLPVPDAAVAIRLPEEGPSGFFVNGVRSAVAYTNASGVAKFAQVHWNSALGVASIMVTAVKGELHAGALIEQTITDHLASAPTAVAPATKTASSESGTANTPPASTAPVNAVPAAVASTKDAATQRAKVEPIAPKPGTPTSIASVHTGASPDTLQTATTETSASPEPVVSVVNNPSNTGSHGGNKKWILLAVVAVGAGVGAAMAMGLAGKGEAAAASSSGISIGAPSVSVGH